MCSISLSCSQRMYENYATFSGASYLRWTNPHTRLETPDGLTVDWRSLQPIVRDAVHRAFAAVEAREHPRSAASDQHHGDAATAAARTRVERRRWRRHAHDEISKDDESAGERLLLAFGALLVAMAALCGTLSV